MLDAASRQIEVDLGRERQSFIVWGEFLGLVCSLLLVVAGRYWLFQRTLSNA